jgi:hypothetical protein
VRTEPRPAPIVYSIVRARLARLVLPLASAITIALAPCATVCGAGRTDMRARVTALRYFPFMSVQLSTEAYSSLYHPEYLRLSEVCRANDDAKCFAKSLQPKEAVLSRVYDQPRAGARELGVIIGRLVVVPERADIGDTLGVELVCRLHGAGARPRWVEQHVFEYGTLALGMEFRLARNGEAEWAKLPPTACGEPVWWPMRSTDVQGSQAEAPGGLYSLPAVHGEIAYTGTPVRLDPQATYRILRIHDGVLEVRRQIQADLDLDGTPLAPPPPGPVPPTIRIKLGDVLDADGRLRLRVAYPGLC